jgi:uncharacterized membrane protein YphA (DoxX/SURF4 family)
MNLRITPADIGVLACRLVVGVLFLVAGLEKIAHIDTFAASIQNYRLTSPQIAVILATVLPWAELFSGLGVLMGIWTRGSALLTSVFLAVFTLAVISAIARHMDISCGCFTQDPQAQHVGWRKVMENTALLCASLVALFSHRMEGYPGDLFFRLRRHHTQEEGTR